MKCWGAIETPRKIEFTSYSSQYQDQVLEVIRKSFFRYETVSIGSEIDKNLDAQKDLELLCIDVLKRSDVSLIARDVEKDLVVGVALNVLQVDEINSYLNDHELIAVVFVKVKQPSTDAPSYFETFRDQHCKTESSKSLMNYMIEADSRVDVFEYFQVTSLLEIMFLAVLEDYGRLGIGYNLCKHSVELAQDLNQGKDVDIYLPNGEPLPQVVSSLFTGTNTQVIGAKLGFEVIYHEAFSNFSFNGKTFAERNGKPNLEYQVAAKRI